MVHSGADYSPEGRKRKHRRDLKLIQLELEENPSHPFHLFNLGMTYADMSLHAQAVRALEKSIAVGRAGETHLRKAFALLAGSYFRLGELERAMEVCRRGVGLYPEDVELLFLKGVLAQRMGYTDEAERSYRLLLEGNTQRYFASIDSGIKVYKARHNLATLYLDAQLHDRAVAQWTVLLEQHGNYIPAWEGLIEALLKQQCYDQATAIMDKMLASSEDSDVALRAEILRTQIALARGAVPEARRSLEETVARHPDHPLVEKTWARFMFEHAPPEQALEALLRLQRRCPEDAAAYHNLGIIYSRMGKLDQAVEQLKMSLKLRPNFPATHKVLAAVRLQQGAYHSTPSAPLESLT